MVLVLVLHKNQRPVQKTLGRQGKDKMTQPSQPTRNTPVFIANKKNSKPVFDDSICFIRPPRGHRARPVVPQKTE